MSATLAKIIRQGNSQALRIPAAYRLPSKEVEIYRTANGLLVIDPSEREAALAALRGMCGRPDGKHKRM